MASSTVTIPRVCPSGFALDSSTMPVIPPPSGLFTGTNLLPFNSFCRKEISPRALVSVPPPGAFGIMTVMSPSAGYAAFFSVLPPQPATPNNMAVNINKVISFFIVFSPFTSLEYSYFITCCAWLHHVCSRILNLRHWAISRQVRNATAMFSRLYV